MPSEPHIIPKEEATWVCINCIRAWGVEATPICTICNAIAIQCQYCAMWKPDYELYNVQFIGEDDGEGNEFSTEVEEICNICLEGFCKEYDIELNFDMLSTVADDIANSDWGYDSSCKQTDEEDIL